MGDAIHQFSQIYLGSRGGVSQGQLKITNQGFTWRRSGGGNKTVEVRANDIESLHWTRVHKGCQLGIRRREGTTVNFLGFREKDYEQLGRFCQEAFGQKLKEQSMSLTGRNWGNVVIHGSSLMFLVDGKVAFEIPLPDVSSAQQSKDELMLEFHVDDTAVADKEDTLVEMAFHVPGTNADFEIPEGETPVKVLLDNLLQHTDAGASTSDEAVCHFEDVAILAPRGRFNVEMHLSFIKLIGQTQDFKIRYQSIIRLFILPKSSTPHTLVVISLDPPIRKGQTYYSHLLCQFPSDKLLEDDFSLDISDEQLAIKNEKCGGKLQREVTGYLYEGFAKVLRGLSGAKLTKPGSFRNAAKEYAIRCSYKADDGYLYPLERAFFYIHKPPILIAHDDISSVEFQRQGAGVLSSSVKTFDLVIRLKNEQEHQFRNLQRTEWQNLFEFIHLKQIPIENLAQAQQGPGGAGTAYMVGDDDRDDPGIRSAVAEADESEDEDFQGEEDDDSSAGSSGSDGGSDASSSGGSSDAEMIEEDGITPEAMGMGKKRKGGSGGGGDAGPSGPPPAAKKTAPPKEKAAPKAGKGKAAATQGGEDAKGKKPRKKKDPNAPKKAMSAFMFFSNTNREKIKAENPGTSFGEMGKLLGEKWKSMSPAEKVQYEEMAQKDKDRYAKAMKAYAGNAADAGDDDEEGEGMSD